MDRTGNPSQVFENTVLGSAAWSKELPSTAFNAPAGTWTLAVLPDTQNYTKEYPEVFNRQCEWIAAHRQRHNILFVAHEGDLTDDNSPAEWANVRKAMSILNDAGIPYALTLGNHDIGPFGQREKDRSTLLNDYFSEKDYESNKASGLFETGKMQNSWHEFETPAGKYLVLALEYGPRDIIVDWANQVVAKHPAHKVILLTHAYLYHDSTRYDFQKYGGEQRWNPKAKKALVKDGNVNDGQDIWEKLVSKHSNFQFTLSGHVLMNGTGYLASQAPDGHTVHQILANYQAAVELDDGTGVPAVVQPDPRFANRPFGGGGFLRLMQFSPDGKTVAVKTYSPWYDHWLTQPDQQFSIKLTS